MPELEEGNIWIQAQFPLNSSLEEVLPLSQKAHEIMKRYPEAEMVLRRSDGPTTAPIRPVSTTRNLHALETGIPVAGPAGRSHPRTKQELTDELSRELKGTILSVEWNFSQNIRNMVMESMSGVRGENSVRSSVPISQELEARPTAWWRTCRRSDGWTTSAAIGSWASRTCAAHRQTQVRRWNLKVGDVQAVGETAVGGKPFSQMIEGERSFDITLRFPKEQRRISTRSSIFPWTWRETRSPTARLPGSRRRR